MVRILGLVRGGWSESPREITSRTPLATDSGDNNGWLIRFFDSAFFCEWIAVSYLYKHHHSGVRDYLCNRMYTLPLSGIETYLFQICYMMVHKPSPSLDKFVIDICSNSLKIALKVHWFLLAELEDVDDNEGISRIQEKCQLAATLMGDWPLLLRHANTSTSPSGKLPVLNRILSSKQRLLSLATSPPTHRSESSYPSPGNNLQDDVNILSPEENKIFKRFIPSPRVRDALLFRKSAEKDEDESENDGFFKRLLRDSKCEDRELASTSEGFFKRLLMDSKSADDELRTSTSESFLKRLLRDSNEDDELASNSDGFYKRLFLNNSNNDSDEKPDAKSVVDDEIDGSFQKLLKEKFEDKKDFVENNEHKHSKNTRARASESAEDEEKNGFFRKILKDVFEEKKNANDKSHDKHCNGEEEEFLDFSLFRKLFRVHPVENKNTTTSENKKTSGSFQGSPGTENFFRKLFRDRDRCVEDSEIFGSKKHKEKRPGSPKQKRDKSNSKPPLPGSIMSQSRKGAYHDSLDFVQSLCETSYRLVDFPAEDRHTALYESIAEINSHVAGAETNGGVCFPAGKEMFRVIHIPEDEAVLLNSREKAPYMICVEVLKCEMPSNTKDSSGSQKHSGNGIPLAYGDTLLAKPPPWAYPLGASKDVYHSSSVRISSSAAEAIDRAMSQNSETTKLKTVNVSLYVEKTLNIKSESMKAKNLLSGESNSDLVSTLGFMASMSSEDGEHMDLCLKTSHVNEELVRVVLTGDPGIRLDNIEDQRPPHCKELRRFPSTLAQEDINAAVAKEEAPSGLTLKGACQTGEEPSDALSKSNGNLAKASDALCGELWEEKKKRIKKASAYGKLPGWDLCSVIVKSGDDCRQEHLAVQLISHFYDIFQEAGLPLWLRPYEVIVTSSYSALIETIPDTASLHSIKSRFPYMSSLREFFAAKYQENSQSFKLAQRNFVESMAGYSLLCYLLQVKDRHNGNLLLDEEGHVIHIDFGFMLSNSPGGVNFETAPFKLTRELLEVMDSDGEGVPSEFFDYFKVLCIQGFLTCRKHAERIILLAEMLEDSGFPCFSGGPRTMQNLRKRFHLSLTEEQCVSFVLTLISSSLDAWRTRQYDYYQRVLNGIL